MADLPAEQLEGAKGTSAFQKLKDLWWRICTKEGKQIPKYDRNYKVIGSTSVELEAGWNATNFAVVNEKLDAIIKILNTPK